MKRFLEAGSLACIAILLVPVMAAQQPLKATFFQSENAGKTAKKAAHPSASKTLEALQTSVQKSSDSQQDVAVITWESKYSPAITYSPEGKTFAQDLRVLYQAPDRTLNFTPEDQEQVRVFHPLLTPQIRAKMKTSHPLLTPDIMAHVKIRYADLNKIQNHLQKPQP